MASGGESDQRCSGFALVVAGSVLVWLAMIAWAVPGAVDRVLLLFA